MKAITNTAPNILEWQEWPQPEPAAGQVRIRVEACGICATDLEMIKGWGRNRFPAIPGHEWCGRVDTAGAGVDAALVGRRVVANNVWADGGEVGFEHYGGYGHYLLTEAANLYPLPETFPAHVGALIEPLAVVTRGLKRLQPDLGVPALVLGDGPIGLLTLMALQAAGVSDVAMIGGRAGRLALARELGASETVSFLDYDPDGLIRRVGREFGTVVEASGSNASFYNALRLVAHEGKILLLGGDGGKESTFRVGLIQHKEMTVVGTNASAGAWGEAVALALSGKLPLEKLVSRRFPASDFADAFALVRGEQSEVVKVVLEWFPA